MNLRVQFQHQNIISDIIIFSQLIQLYFSIFAALFQTLLNISQNLNLRDSFNHI